MKKLSGKKTKFRHPLNRQSKYSPVFPVAIIIQINHLEKGHFYEK
jgi:hypothetical protein